MKYRITHCVHLVALVDYNKKYIYYAINKDGNREYVIAKSLEYARNYYIDHGKTLLPF